MREKEEEKEEEERHFTWCMLLLWAESPNQTLCLWETTAGGERGGVELQEVT